MRGNIRERLSRAPRDRTSPSGQKAFPCDPDGVLAGKPNDSNSPLAQRRRNSSDGIVQHNDSLGYVATVSALIFSIPPLKIETGLLITFLVQIMQQIGIRGRWKLSGHVIDFLEQRQQIRFWMGRRHLRHRAFEFQQSVEKLWITIFHGRSMPRQNTQDPLQVEDLL